MSFGPLIDTADLADLIERRAVLICDCRFDLTDPAAGRRACGQAHIPGAIYIDLEADMSGRPDGLNGRHPLPDRDDFAARMAQLGVRNDLPVVAYDASGGFYASRLWWMLRWLGHGQVAVLDGGWAAWTAAGLPVGTGDEQAPPGKFTPSAMPAMTVTDVAGIEAALGTDRMLVLDARSSDRFMGAPHPLDTASGHIPGARNRFYADNLDETGRFKAAEQLARAFADVLGGASPDRVVHQCGSGVTATHNLLAMEVAGLGGSRLYPGSWSEWTSDPSRPIETGLA